MGLASYADKVRLAIILQNKDINTFRLYKRTTKTLCLQTKALENKSPFHQGQRHAIQKKEQITTTDRCRDHYRSLSPTYSGHGIDQ